MGYYTVENSKRRLQTCFSMDEAKDYCISRLIQYPKTSLMICRGDYVKYDVHREGREIVFVKRDTRTEKRIRI